MFDAYAQFTELSLSTKMEELQANDVPTKDEELEVELLMAR